jgi:hypothetical protein
VNSALQIGTTRDQCSSNYLYVLDANDNYVYIPHDGRWYYVDVGNPRFTWLCGGSNEWTTCDVGTSYVYARHEVGSRAIDWSCQE